MSAVPERMPSEPGRNKGRQAPIHRNWGFLTILGITALLFFLIIRPFLVPVLMGFIVAGASRPLYLFFMRLSRRKAALSALAAILTFVIGFGLPLVFISIQVVKQGISFFQYALGHIESWAKYFSTLQVKLAHWLPFLHLDKANWGQLINQGLNAFFNGGINILNQGLQGAGSFLLAGFVFIFSLHYFYIDWEPFLSWLTQLSPLSPEHNAKISQRFSETSRAVLRTVLVIGVLQGVLGGATFALTGFPAPLFWGFVMILASLLPVIGAGLIWLPAAMIKLFSGHALAGIVIILFGVVVVMGLENLVRPRLVGSQAALHPLPVFIATLGGIAFFGVSGIIIGPLTVAVLWVLLDIYREEIGGHPA